MLIANLQGVDGSGNAISYPGLLGMIAPASAVDLNAVIGAVGSRNDYMALVYQPLNPNYAVQYGYFGGNFAYLSNENPDLFTATNSALSR